MVQEVDTCVVVVVEVPDEVVEDIRVLAWHLDVACEAINEVMYVPMMENYDNHCHWVVAIHASPDDKVTMDVVDKVTLDDKEHLAYVEDTRVDVVVVVEVDT